MIYRHPIHHFICVTAFGTLSLQNKAHLKSFNIFAKARLGSLCNLCDKRTVCKIHIIPEQSVTFSLKRVLIPQIPHDCPWIEASNFCDFSMLCEDLLLPFYFQCNNNPKVCCKFTFALQGAPISQKILYYSCVSKQYQVPKFWYNMKIWHQLIPFFVEKQIAKYLQTCIELLKQYLPH